MGVRQAVVVAGGRATRMAEVFPGRAKATYPLGGKSMLVYLFKWIEDQGLSSVHLCLGHLADQVLQEVPRARSLHVTSTTESEAVGVGGALRLAEPFLEPSFVMLYGDVLPQIRLSDVEPHFQRRDVDIQLAVCLAIRGHEAPNVQLGSNGMLLGYGRSAEATHLDIGVTLIRRRAITRLPSGCVITGPALFENCWMDDQLAACEVEVASLEIGSPEGYHIALQRLSREP